MNEFQIVLSNRASDYKPIFNDPTKDLKILREFKLSEDERQFISNNAHDLLKEYVWRLELPEAYSWGGIKMAMFAAQFRDRETAVGQRAFSLYPQLLQEITNNVIRGEVLIAAGGVPQIAQSIALAVLFSTFRPNELGVLDYHGAQRNYGRESVQGINLNLDANEQQRSQTALYNYSQKYLNVKGEMAASYVKEILAEQAGVPRASQSTLSNTLKELFQTFSPTKNLLGRFLKLMVHFHFR